ncbi:MAG: hypothetical protein R2818_11485 [Flavobacteriales bacterium]
MSSETALLEALHYCIENRLTFAAFPPGSQVTLWAQQTPELDRIGERVVVGTERRVPDRPF